MLLKIDVHAPTVIKAVIKGNEILGAQHLSLFEKSKFFQLPKGQR